MAHSSVFDLPRTRSSSNAAARGLFPRSALHRDCHFGHTRPPKRVEAPADKRNPTFSVIIK